MTEFAVDSTIDNVETDAPPAAPKTVAVLLVKGQEFSFGVYGGGSAYVDVFVL